MTDKPMGQIFREVTERVRNWKPESPSRIEQKSLADYRAACEAYASMPLIQTPEQEDAADNLSARLMGWRTS